MGDALRANLIKDSETYFRKLQRNRRLAASRSASHPTRLETRTKESRARASPRVLIKPAGRNERKCRDPFF